MKNMQDKQSNQYQVEDRRGPVADCVVRYPSDSTSCLFTVMSGPVVIAAELINFATGTAAGTVSTNHQRYQRLTGGFRL